jgi:hypothetical protein
MGDRRQARDSLLADSRATLRQVSGVLRDLEGDDPTGALAAIELDEVQASELLAILLRTYAELVTVIETLRESRGALHRAALERLQRTHEKLQEVTSTTELAATDMLDGLDRAMGLLDTLDDGNVGDADADHAPVRQQLREELHGLISLLQFQDITSQQLGYASGVLMDVEQRLLAVRDVLAATGAELSLAADIAFDDSAPPPSGPGPVDLVDGPRHCDPNASTADAGNRQALADEIFGGTGSAA